MIMPTEVRVRQGFRTDGRGASLDGAAHGFRKPVSPENDAGGISLSWLLGHALFLVSTVWVHPHLVADRQSVAAHCVFR